MALWNWVPGLGGRRWGWSKHLSSVGVIEFQFAFSAAYHSNVVCNVSWRYFTLLLRCGFNVVFLTLFVADKERKILHQRQHHHQQRELSCFFTLCSFCVMIFTLLLLLFLRPSKKIIRGGAGVCWLTHFVILVCRLTNLHSRNTLFKPLHAKRLWHTGSCSKRVPGYSEIWLQNYWHQC